MARWRFSVFVTGHDKAVVQDDIDRFSDDGLEAFKVAVTYLASVDTRHWREPTAKKLKGTANNLHEIRFRASNRQTRAVGFFGPDADEFTITMICFHKGTVYEPSSALDTAEKRRKSFAKGEAKRAPLEFDGEIFPPIPE